MSTSVFHRLRLAFAAFFCVFTAITTAAQTPPEIALGVQWLAAQVQATGALQNEMASIATPMQNRSEAMRTLALLSSVPTALTGAITGEVESNTEYLSRRIIGAVDAGVDPSGMINALAARANEDGGYGGDQGYASNALDTAWVLLAFKAAAFNGATQISGALNYLVQSKQADGGWGVRGSGRPFITSMVLIAADSWKTSYSVGAVTSAARDWLSVSTGNGTFTTMSDNAIALLALATQTAQPTVLQPLTAALKAQQQPDGSWGGDPFITAIALRALWQIGHPPLAATTGDIRGTVFDAQSGLGLAEATVQIVENSAFSTTTDANGGFAFHGLPAGQYTVRVTKLGYGTQQIAARVQTGDTLTISAIPLAKSSLNASLSGTIKDRNGTPLQDVIVAVGTVTANTSQTGAYQLTGLNPGVATITASKPNYQTVSVDVNLAAGVSYTFSPTLYATGTTPPAPSLKGNVIDAITKNPIANATVTLGQAVQTTANDGSFTFANQTEGTFTLSISSAGYQTMSATGTMVSGVNDVGSLALTKAAATSIISGKVTDADSGTAIAGATVAIQGSNLIATSDASGTYQISGIANTDFKILLSASGYLSSTYSVALPQAGASTVNLKMVKTQATGITFESVHPSKSEYGATDEWKIELEVKNTTNNTASLIIDAQIFDEQKNIVQELKGNANGLGLNPPNLPLTFAAASVTDVDLEKQVVRQSAGTYTAVVRAYDGTGVVMAEANTQFTVRQEAVLAGAVVVDPPLAQAGTNTPVRISAQLGNFGNAPIVAGTVDLTVTLTHPDTDVSTQPQTNVQTLTSGSPLNYPRGLVSDAAGNFYTVNYTYNDGKIIKIDPQGKQTLFATIPTNKNPYLIGLTADAQGNLWVANGSNSKVWQVNQEGIVSELTLTLLDVISGIDIDATGNLVVTGSKGGEQRLVKRLAQGGESVLWANGLSSPVALVKDGQGNLVVSNYGDNTLVKLSMSGVITPFVSGLNRPMGLAADGAGNIYVANNGDGKIVKVAPDGAKSDYATGLPAPVDIKFDSNGILYVSAQTDNAIYRIQANGSVELVGKGIANGPQGMKYDAAGNLYIVNDDGTVRMKDASDQVTIMATGLSSPRGLDITPSGDLFIASYGNGVITKLSGAVKSTFATGLANPHGVAIDGAGHVHVTERSQNRITELDSTGAVVSRVESFLFQPSSIRVAGDGKVYVLNNGFVTVIENSAPRILFRDFTPTAIACDPANGGLVAQRSYDMYRISATGVATKIKTLPFYPYAGVAADAAGNFVIPDYYGKRVVKMDSAGTITPFADLPSYPRAIVTDTAGTAYVLLDTYRILKIANDGSSSVLFSTSEYPYGLNIGSDGNPLIWTNYGKLYAINASTGAPTVLKTNYSPSDVAADAAGQLQSVTSSENDLVTFNASGTEVARLNGFAYPWDIVWTGSELRFVDNNNRLFRLVPGGYPTRIASSFNVYYLAQRGSDTYGGNGSTIYKWNGTTQSVTSISGTSSLYGIATRPDGSLSIADNGTSRVVTFDSGNNMTSDFASIVRPQGLAFDAQGRLYVANNGNSTIVRFDVGSKAPNMFVRSSSPQYLAFDPSGNLWVTHSSSVDKVDSKGVVSSVNGTAYFQGILVDGTGAYGVSQSNGHIRKYNGQGWDLFAAGLSSPEGVRIAADGSVYVANRGNNTVTKLVNGRLDVIVGDLAAPHTVALAGDGKIYIAGDAGTVTQIAADGSISDLKVASLLGNKQLYGIAASAAGNVAVLTYDGASSSLYRLSISQPATPPAAGTVVYHTQKAIDAIAVGEAQLAVNFGEWIPPYGGDYKVEITYPSVSGLANNFLHVGPFAQGALSASNQTIPPGDAKVSLNLKLTGADFTSISRVETGLIRKLVPISQPKGMAGDKAGNIWYTDTGSLNKTTPAGVTTTVVPNISPAFGLAIDAQEQLYLPARNASGRYELLRIQTDGTKTAVADLGTTQVNGVAVNSAGDVLIGSTGKLLKYSVATNTLSVVSTAGLPYPRGIAIDGRDNVYVQNESNSVSMIKPDGSTVSIFSKGDGVEEPVFEGDGYPNIAADCADNFYIAASSWDKIKQSGEEHILAQVIARTGRVSALFNGLQISSNLSDIDYLAFDRFTNRILMWTHGADEIWQVPVTCGAIGVEVHLITKPGQVLTGFSKAPNAAIPLADNRTEYVWSLRDVTSQGASIGFDTVLAGLQLGERRNTLDSGYLLFKNSFSPDDVKVPLDVPVVTAANLVNLGATTDRPEYLANAVAQVAASLTNSNTGAVGGDLKVEVYDVANVLVGSITRQSVTMAANETITVNGSYGIGTIVPGTYTVKASLTDNGIVTASAVTNFKVLADQSQATAKSTLSVDKQRYAPRDRVTIASRVIDQSANAFVDNLMLNVKITDVAGTELFTKTYQLAQLAPGASSSFTTPYTLSNPPPGTYRVVQVLSEASGRIYDTQTVSFDVGATADSGSGLIGSIAAVPKQVALGDAVALSLTATNSGNSVLNAAMLKVSIVDPEKQKVLAEFPYSRNLAIGEIANMATSWTAQGTAGATYIAVLSAQFPTGTVTLAQDSFVLTAVSTKLDIKQALARTSRVLVWVSCDGGEDDDDCHDDDGKSGKKDDKGKDATPKCLVTRVQAIDQLLSGLNIAHQIVTDADAFTYALRSGIYNTYWLTGRQDKLHDNLPGEIREAVFAGATLIQDGVHDERNKQIDDISGVQVRGGAGSGQTVTLSGPFYPAAAVLPTIGQDKWFQVNDSAQVQGTFTAIPESDSDDHGKKDQDDKSKKNNGKPNALPALVSNRYGAGQTLAISFDLTGTLVTRAGAWTDAFKATLDAMTPPAAALTPGALLPVTTTVVNQGTAVDIGIRSTLPPGAAILGSDPTGIYNAGANTIDWLFPLGDAQTRNVLLTLRVPGTPGDYSLQTVISTLKSGTATPYGDKLAIPFKVTAAAQNSADATKSLQAIALKQKKDQQLRDKLVGDLKNAMASFNKNTAKGYADAIDGLLDILDRLSDLSGADTTDAHKAIGSVLQEAQWRWTLLQPAKPGAK